MKKLVFTLIVCSIFFLSFISAETVILNDANTQFSLSSWINHLFGTSSFSIIGDSRQCSGTANDVVVLQSGQSVIFNAATYCSSGFALFDVFTNGYSRTFGEYKENINNGVFCSEASAPCNVEVYCCPRQEPTSDSECASWYGTGSKKVTATANDPNIVYKSGSTYSYCSEPSAQQAVCWYYPGSGSCQSRTYVGQPQSVCGTGSYATYSGYKLFGTNSACTASIPTCTNGQTQACTISGQAGTATCSSGSWGACVANQITCTSFTYNAWSTCSGGTQTRTIATRTPTSCTGGNPVTTQTCTANQSCLWTGPCPSNNPNCLCPVRANGAACTEDYMCQSNLCSNNVCTFSCTNGQESCDGTNLLLCTNSRFVSQGQVAGKCNYTAPVIPVGQACSYDNECLSLHCDRTKFYSLQKTCQPTPWDELFVVGAYKEDVKDFTVNDMLSIACIDKDKCIAPDANSTASCIRLSELQRDDVVNLDPLTITSFYNSALDHIAKGTVFAVGGAVGGGIGGLAVCTAGTAALAVSGVATVSAPVFAFVCGTVFTGGGAIVGGTLGLQQGLKIVDTSDDNQIVKALKAKDSNSVGLCIAEKKSGGLDFLKFFAFFSITGDPLVDGAIILGILILVVVLVLK